MTKFANVVFLIIIEIYVNYDGCRLNHWVLLVINPGAEMIYYMDSLSGGHPDIDDVKRKFMK